MYDSITGELARVGPDYVSVVCGGVGYRLHVPTSYLPRLGAKAGARLTFFLHLHVTDGDLKLFAFENEPERDLFKLLQSVTGVGPSLALALLSGAGPGPLVRAVTEKDLGALTRIKGVGRKTAERLCLELQDKLGGFAAALGEGETPSERSEQVAAALVALGYHRAEARRLAESVTKQQPAERDLEVLLKSALAYQAS
jgi:Holliday junction DNA helicase RuvA